MALLVLLTCVLATGRPALAQGKWEVAPFAGYETPGSFLVTTNQTTGTQANMHAVGGGAYGGFLDYNFLGPLGFEAQWDHNATTFSVQNADGSYSKVNDSNVDAVTFGVRFMFRQDNKKVRPYGSVGLGFTHDANNDNVPSQTHFAFAAGGGVEYFPTRHFGLRGDARLFSVLEGTTLGLECDIFNNCFEANVHAYLKRGDFIGGLVFRF
jgi:opacity protein-like surface antigen